MYQNSKTHWRDSVSLIDSGVSPIVTIMAQVHYIFIPCLQNVGHRPTHIAGQNRAHIKWHKQRSKWKTNYYSPIESHTALDSVVLPLPLPPEMPTTMNPFEHYNAGGKSSWPPPHAYAYYFL